MGGATIVPRSLKTKRNKKKFKIGKFFYYFLNHNMTLLYLLVIDFPILDPLTATEKVLCVNLGSKCQNLFPLVSD
jgi:hypothetical protein